MDKYAICKFIGASVIAVSLGCVITDGKIAMAQSDPIWYNCLTREVFTPEKQAWCDRWQALQEATYIVPVGEAADPTYTTVTLSAGRYEAVNNGQFSVELVNQEGWMAFGDLTSDGQDDAVVVLRVVDDSAKSEAITYLSIQTSSRPKTMEAAMHCQDSLPFSTFAD